MAIRVGINGFGRIGRNILRAADALPPVTLGAGAPLLARRVELKLEEVGRNGDFVSARFTVAEPR